MNKSFLVAYLLTRSLSADVALTHKEITMEETNKSPDYLYKILSLKNWQATNRIKAVQLSSDDNAFIHFST
jgi:hypothetical protein